MSEIKVSVTVTPIRKKNHSVHESSPHSRENKLHFYELSDIVCLVG